MNPSRSGLLALFVASMAVIVAACTPPGPSPSATAWWQPVVTRPVPRGATNEPASLESVLGPGADLDWSVASGDYVIGREPGFDHGILTADGRTTLVLSNRTHYPAGVAVSARLRLRGTSPGAYLAVARARIPNPDKPGQSIERNLRLLVTASPATGHIQANAQQDNKALHDLKALTEDLDWHSPWQNGFGYEPRAYTKFLPGWPADFRAQLEH
ncbi:hypothetical protein HQ590_06150, partial [bacterium]|nr:hypothetical protein [bacterium]